jgi:excisionase family DNA binding protein
VFDAEQRPELPMSEVPFEVRVFSFNEACSHLRVSRGTGYALVKQGRLEVVKLARRTVVTGRAIRKCLDASYDANKAVQS